MPKEMLINSLVPDNVRVAITLDGKLEAFFEEFEGESSSRANIYLGRVVNIEPSLEACFVEYGAERHGFLPISEILPHAWANKSKQKGKVRIEKVMKRGQTVVIQVEKEAAGTKGARLTTNLSLAGRFMVLMPYSDTRGVSRKINDPEQRRTCREVAATMQPPKGMGLIVRTAGLGHGKRELLRDLNYLLRLWKAIEKKSGENDQARLLHAEADLVLRVLRDYYSTDVERVIIDDGAALRRAEGFFKVYMPRQRELLKAFSEKVPIFSHFGIEEQIEAIHKRRVLLPSGGSLVIDQTEALVAIDVNSGKMKGQSTQEDTAYETNLEAAREIARQLKLRDMGGIVVIDFIDMTTAARKTAVERALRDELKAGKARHRVGKISTFGLCTLTRQRLGKSILSARHRECPTCGGTGAVADLDALSVRLLRKIRTRAAAGDAKVIRVQVSPALANFIQNAQRGLLLSCEKEHDIRIEVEAVVGLGWSEEKTEIVSRHKPNGRKPRSGGARSQSGSGQKSQSRKKGKSQQQEQQTKQQQDQKSNQRQKKSQQANLDLDDGHQEQNRNADQSPNKPKQQSKPKSRSKPRSKPNPKTVKQNVSQSQGKPATVEGAQNVPPSEAPGSPAEVAGAPKAKPKRKRRRRKKKPQDAERTAGLENKTEQRDKADSQPTEKQKPGEQRPASKSRRRKPRSRKPAAKQQKGSEQEIPASPSPTIDSVKIDSEKPPEKKKRRRRRRKKKEDGAELKSKPE